jgi:hypothetical protein
VGFWTRLFRRGDSASPFDFTTVVKRKYGVVASDGQRFVYIGAYFDGAGIPSSTPEECAAQVNTLTAEEICILAADPVLIILGSDEKAPVAIRTALPASRAQEFLSLLKSADVRIDESGKICLVRRSHKAPRESRPNTTASTRRFLGEKGVKAIFAFLGSPNLAMSQRDLTKLFSHKNPTWSATQAITLLRTPQEYRVHDAQATEAMIAAVSEFLTGEIGSSFTPTAAVLQMLQVTAHAEPDRVVPLFFLVLLGSKTGKTQLFMFSSGDQTLRFEPQSSDYFIPS